MILSATVSPVYESALASSGAMTDRPVCANLTAQKTATGADAPPLQSRIRANRDNARKSTGPKTAEGKSSSRDDAVTHWLTSRVALPRETGIEIAGHFWQMVQAYRPTDAVTVNAILELTICSWKFRRLFEQYASHQSRTRITVNDDRKARENRLAQRWFRKLSEDPRKALAHLNRTSSGLSLIVEHFENLIAELNQPEGSWTSRQFLLAVNLGGFDDFEVWDNVQLRVIWSAWFACRPGRKATPEDVNSILPAYPEYRNRARKAIETAPLAAEGRRQLIEWVRTMRDAAARRLAVQEQVENDLDKIQPMAAGWPAPEETSQHMLYLRYSNQVDRKARELQSLIAARSAVSGGDSWKFEDDLLPSDWKALLIQYRTIRTVADGVVRGEMTGVAGEVLMKENLFELSDMTSLRNPEKLIGFDVQDDASPSNRTEPLESIASQPVTNSEIPVPEATSADVEIKAGLHAISPIDSADPACLANSPTPEDRNLPVPIDSRLAAEVVTGNETQAPIRPVSGIVPGIRRRSPAPPKSNHRRLRPDKATDVRKDHHRHTGTKPVRPPETR